MKLAHIAILVFAFQNAFAEEITFKKNHSEEQKLIVVNEVKSNKLQLADSSYASCRSKCDRNLERCLEEKNRNYQDCYVSAKACAISCSN